MSKMRIIGVDDGAFQPRKNVKQRTLIVGVLFQNLKISAIRVGQIEVDGTDAKRVLVSLLRGLRFDIVMLSGLSFGGFNLVDISKLATALRKPIIAVTGERPDNVAVRKALHQHFIDWKERWKMVRAAGRIYSCKPLRNEPKLYFEVRGGSSAAAKNAIGSTAVISRLPEPIRVARILARSFGNVNQPSLP